MLEWRLVTGVSPRPPRLRQWLPEDMEKALQEVRSGSKKPVWKVCPVDLQYCRRDKFSLTKISSISHQKI